MALTSCILQGSHLWRITPLMHFGSCQDIIENIRQYYDTNLNNEEMNESQLSQIDEQIRLCFNEQSLQPLIRSILSALVYLHSRHIIHRCVCPSTIYISKNGQVKLGGLKYAVSLISQGILLKKLHTYPTNIEEYLKYLSPELLQQVIISLSF
jgi:serine/threonine protein kinase